MGIYIKGMEMPTGKDVLTVAITADGEVFSIGFDNTIEGGVFLSHPSTYPIQAVPVPPHGRLIDADKLFKRMFVGSDGPDYNALGFGCGINRASCKEDCYWYREEPDMGAHIPYCAATGKFPIDAEDCTDCKQYHSKYHTTNADRIRAMTDEKLADELLTAFAAFYDVEWSKEAVLDWLKQEAGE